MELRFFGGMTLDETASALDISPETAATTAQRASFNVEQIPHHLNRATVNGLSKAQASEMLTRLAFYARWPRVFCALPIVNRIG